MTKLKPKIYLETTLFNYYFLNDPTRQADIEATKKLFESIKKEKFSGFISDIVLRELQRCPDQELRTKMLSLTERFKLYRLTEKDYAGFMELAEKYILVGAIPKRKLDDALHIAIASLANLDILVSWNYAHIVKYQTRQAVHDINLTLGLTDIIIGTPHEVAYEPQKP